MKRLPHRYFATSTTHLRTEIRRLHGCEASHVVTVPLTDQFQGKIRWQGEVEMFDLHGHPQANRCYAWAYLDEDNKQQFTAVLEMPPVDSPRAAVRAALFTGADEN